MGMGRFIDDDAIVLSEPIERFVDVVLTPTTLTTAPFFDIALSGPGLVLIPAPGLGKALLLRQIVFVSEQTKAGWGSDLSIQVFWGPASEGNSPLFNVASIQGFGMAAVNGATSYPNQTVGLPQGGSLSQPASSVENKPITLYNTRDLTAFSAFVAALNQGTKTFTFQGALDFLTPGPTITITGSTGNDGAYTVVSSSVNDDLVNPLTDVVVAEAIPDATADGSTQLTGMGTRRLFVRLYSIIVPTRSF